MRNVEHKLTHRYTVVVKESVLDDNFVSFDINYFFCVLFVADILRVRREFELKHKFSFYKYYTHACNIHMQSTARAHRRLIIPQQCPLYLGEGGVHTCAGHTHLLTAVHPHPCLKKNKCLLSCYQI